VGRPVRSNKTARVTKFQKNRGMCRWHGVCGTPGHHDRSGDLGGSAGGGAGSSASAPAAGGPPPPDAAPTSVGADFKNGSAVGGVLLLQVGGGRRDDYRGRSACRGPCPPMRGALGAPHYDPGCRGSAEARTATAVPRQRADLSRPHFKYSASRFRLPAGSSRVQVPVTIVATSCLPMRIRVSPRHTP
jgi:hypothetical protein